MTEIRVREEVLRLITGGSVKQNVEALLRLIDRYQYDLQALKVGSDDSVKQVAFIGGEALSAGQIVFEQIQKETLQTGFPPVSAEEILRMQTAMKAVRPMTMAALVRTAPVVFGEPGDLLLKADESETGLTVMNLCAAYINSARQLKDAIDMDPDGVSTGLYNHFYRSILVGLAMSEEIKTGKGLENRGTTNFSVAQDALREAIFAKIASACATKAMRDFKLDFAPGGLQVDVLDGDEIPITLIRIPVAGDGSTARANSEMNAAIAKVVSAMRPFRIPTNVVFSFRRIA